MQNSQKINRETECQYREVPLPPTLQCPMSNAAMTAAAGAEVYEGHPLHVLVLVLVLGEFQCRSGLRGNEAVVGAGAFVRHVHVLVPGLGGGAAQLCFF